MPRDGSGVFSKVAGTTAVSGTAIESAKYNSVIDDFATDANTPRPIVAGGTGASTAAAARTALGVQAADAGLTSIAGLTTAADKMIYTTASDTYAVTDLTAAGRALLDDANASAMLTTLGVSAYAKTLLDDADASAALTTLGVSTFAKTILDDADAAGVLTTLGFSGTIADPGSITIPNGGTNSLIIKWGVSGAIPNGGSTIVTFSAAFPTTCLRVIVGPIVSGTNTSAFSVGAYNLSASQFIATNNSGSSGSAQAAWLAIGR